MDGLLKKNIIEYFIFIIIKFDTKYYKIFKYKNIYILYNLD